MKKVLLPVVFFLLPSLFLFSGERITFDKFITICKKECREKKMPGCDRVAGEAKKYADAIKSVSEYNQSAAYDIQEAGKFLAEKCHLSFKHYSSM